MNNFKIKAAIGIGDIIIVYSYFQTLKEKYDKLVFYPDDKFFSLRGNNYKLFISDFFNWMRGNNTKLEVSFEPVELGVFKLNNCVITPEKYISPINLRHLIPDNNEITEPYICINTKIRRDGKISGYNVEDLITTLHELSNRFKIVLLGEQEISNTWENQILIKKGELESIYLQLKQLKNVIDLTITSEDITDPKLNHILNDLSLYKNAKFNINIGNGGNVFLSGISGKCINLTGYPKFFNLLLTDSTNLQNFTEFNDELKKYNL